MLSVNQLRVFAFLPVILLGCSESPYPTTYQVTGSVQMGGKPVVGALVTFNGAAGTKNASGLTNDKGEFRLSTFDPGDGALPGTFKVSIIKSTSPDLAPAQELPQGVIASGEIADDYAPPTGFEGRGKSPPKNELPAKYAKDSTTDLSATVAENDDNRFEFNLTK